MTKLPALLVAAALLTAACGAAATQSSSSAQPASIAGVRVAAGPNAKSDVSDVTNRQNPPTHPAGSTPFRLPAPTAVAAPRGSEPPDKSAWDRCRGGIGVDLSGQKRPVPECNTQ